MAIVFVLRAFQLNDSVLAEQRLVSLPIRIGRNALADFQLPHGYLSDFHAVIEDIDGRLYVRDLEQQKWRLHARRRPTHPGADRAPDFG